MAELATDKALVLGQTRELIAPEIDPLDWLGDEKAKLIREREDGFAFWQATVTFSDGQSTRIAFSGDSIEDPEGAEGHTIYIEKPELISRLIGLEYDDTKKAWEVENTESRIFLVGKEVEKGGRGEYSLEDGMDWEPYGKDSESPGFNASVDSDVAAVEMRVLVEKQVEAGVKIEWLG